MAREPVDSSGAVLSGLLNPPASAAVFEVAGDVPVVDVVVMPMFKGLVTEAFRDGGEAGSTGPGTQDWALSDHVDVAYCRSRGFNGKLGETLRMRSVRGRAVSSRGDDVSAHSDGGSNRAVGPTGSNTADRSAAGYDDTYDLMFAGLGDESTVDLEALRRASAAVVRSVEPAKSAAMVLTGLLAGTELDPARVAQAVVEGVRLGAYEPGIYKAGRAQGSLERFLLVAEVAGTERRGALMDGVRRGEIIADAVCLARNLVNQPAGFVTPRALADVAQRLAGETPEIETVIWDEAAIKQEGLGGLAGVSQGSAEPPRMIRIAYTPEASGTAEQDIGASGVERATGYEPVADAATPPAPASAPTPPSAPAPPPAPPAPAPPPAPAARCPTVVLVGKGITFDSGGLSLKSAEGMSTMKTDMSGGAAVLATFAALARLKPSVRVIGFVPAAENMPGPGAMKPGDVVRARNGKTIEVLNTDAEGRLILADALSLACEEKPDAIIDAATLTGACMTALGPKIAGLMGNDESLVNMVRSAGDAAGEPLWPLPLPREYRDHIDSDIADMKNIGLAGGKAGALAAGLLLAEFIDGVPWAHLDIAGPARCDTDDGYLRKGGTGFGVRTLLELLASFAKAGRASE